MRSSEMLKARTAARPWWQRYFVDYLYTPGEDLSTVQLHGWAVLLGILGALVSLIYYYSLRYAIQVLWYYLPTLLDHAGVFDKVPSWVYVFFVCTLGGAIVGGLLTWMPSPGSVPLLLESLHTKGYMAGHHWPSMLCISLVAMAFGSALGPEGPVLVIMASIVGKIDEKLHQTERVKRILTLCSMGGAIAAFFGLPLAGALFVLEIPHRMGLQYYEALTPAVLSSMVSVFIANGVRRQAFDGIFPFPPPPTKIYSYHMLLGVLYGLLGAAVAAILTFIYHQLKSLVTLLRLSRRPFVLALAGGVILGIMGAIMPMLLFWSETELEALLLQEKSSHLGSLFPGIIRVNYKSAAYFLGLGCFKAIAIVILLATGWPGGVVFPLFLVAASFALSLTLWLPALSGGIAIPCMMAAITTCLLRIPWSSNIIVLLLATVPSRAITVFPVVCIAAQVALFVTRALRFYPRQVQRSRGDIVPAVHEQSHAAAHPIQDDHAANRSADSGPQRASFDASGRTSVSDFDGNAREAAAVNPFTENGILDRQLPNEDADLGIPFEKEPSEREMRPLDSQAPPPQP